MSSKKELLFEEYKLAIELAEKEADRFWMRNNVLLLVQAALIAFFDSVKSVGSIYGALVAAQGFFLALIWIGVLVKGKNYISRWDNVSRNIERKMVKTYSGELLGLRQLSDKVKEKDTLHPIKFLNKSTTVLIKYVIYSLLFFWGVLFIVDVAPILINIVVTKMLPYIQQICNLCLPIN